MQKRLLSLAFALAFAGTAVVHADETTTEPNVMVVNTVDGQSYRFIITPNPDMTDRPGVGLFCFGSDAMWMDDKSDLNHLDNSLSFSRDEVKHITFETVEPNGIEAMNADQQRVTFKLQNDKIDVSGLQAGDRIAVAKADGRSVMNLSAASGGHAVIDLSRQGSGVYVVSVNKSFTFKIMKP
jgi:hypothetical protein